MSVKEIKPNVYSIRIIDWDRRLFDELVPLPRGTSYNSCIIKGSEKNALIDTADFSKSNDFTDIIKNLNIKIDYLIAQHAEQDHSGTIPDILKIYPDAKVVTNPKCKEFLIDMFSIPDDRFMEVKDRDSLSLGNKTLEFIHAPWVHWPDTMLTYLKEDKILFSTDFLGSHLATSDLYVTDEPMVYESAKRYYAEIMMPFRTSIKKHLETIKHLSIDIISPSHGPLYNKPEFIINAYKDWIGETVKNEVVIPYVSMHGSTEKMVQYLTNALIDRNITVKPFNLTRTDIGELAISLVDAATVVIGSSTVLVGPHPNIVYGVYLVNALRPKLKFGTVIGSYGWGGKMLDQIKGMLTNLKIELLEPVIIKGFPKENDFAALDKLADEIAQRHKTIV